MGENIFEDPADPPRMKMAVIAGASEALKKKAKDWKKSDGEIMQEISDNIEEIIKGID
ncbi:MAG: hypothetical protein U9Q06_02070 [Nanoarchaeota archaeon]|nr:hypothetical protein [Nanoarchaeota archaeon]